MILRIVEQGFQAVRAESNAQSAFLYGRSRKTFPLPARKTSIPQLGIWDSVQPTCGYLHEHPFYILFFPTEALANMLGEKCQLVMLEWSHKHSFATWTEKFTTHPVLTTQERS